MAQLWFTVFIYWGSFVWKHRLERLSDGAHPLHIVCIIAYEVTATNAMYICVTSLQYSKTTVEK